MFFEEILHKNSNNKSVIQKPQNQLAEPDKHSNKLPQQEGTSHRVVVIYERYMKGDKNTFYIIYILI